MGQIQTKFSSIHGQDPENMPYDPRASVTEQVHASIRSSLHNLRPSEEAQSSDQAYIDMVVLHSPMRTMDETLEVWSALESYVPHQIRNLGISNCTLPVLKGLYASPKVRVRPAVVQNRFYPATQFDVPLRAFCRENQLIYQSFWTLTANPPLVQSDAVQLLASGAAITPAAAMYCLVMGLGNTTVLNGTTNEGRMEADLAAPKKVERLVQEQPGLWERALGGFKTLIGDTSVSW